MKILVLIAVLGLALYQYLDGLQEQAYQAKAVRCAENPDLLGCEAFNTAAGQPAKDY